MTDYSNVIRSTFGTGARSQAVSNVDVNPDDAARAYELEKVTGVPSSIISGDLDSFESQHKALLAGDIVGGNPYIGEYVNSHPLAAQISNDDYGNLDAVSQHLQPLSRTRNPILGPAESAWAGTKGVVSSLGDAFTHGFDNVSADKGRLEGSLEASVNTVVGLGSSLLNAPLTFLHEYAKSAGGEELGNIVGAFGEGVMSTIGTHTPEIEAATRVGPWVKSGEVPPNGLHPLIDQAKTEMNKSALEMLDGAVKEAQSSTTKERAPELFQGFVEQHLQDHRMEISGQRAIELYGDKVPEVDDGVLGFVPNIKEQLEVARDTGADISVPMADWIAKVDPAIHKELHDDLRVVNGGMTAREATEALPPIPSIDEAIPTFRNSASLEPLFSIGDRKLTLQRMAEEKIAGGFGVAQGFHDFDMVNENGQVVGSINLSVQGDAKQLHVDMISGEGEYYHPNNFGPALMRDLLRQIKAQFPDAEVLTGHRVSGARDLAGSVKEPSALPKIRLDNPFEDLSGTHERFAELLNGSWVPVNSNIEAYFKPKELWQEHEHELNDAVTAELNHIVPQGVLHAPVTEMRRTDRRPGPNAMYYPEVPGFEKPIILWAMNANDALGTARHEAIHHLYRAGFFTPEEWSVLQKASKDEGWQKKFNIGQRYRSQADDIKVEESIAEAYRVWADEHELRQRQPGFQQTLVDKVFEKLRDFLETIKQHVRRITGTENADDLFERVHSGEVGSREAEGGIGVGGALADESKAANDLDSFQRDNPKTYRGSLEKQKVEAVVDNNTHKGDFDHWDKIAIDEAPLHNGKSSNQPNAFEAAKNYSKDNKSTMMILPDGRRAVYKNGREVTIETPLFDEPQISEPGQGIDPQSPFRAARDVGMSLDQHKNYMKLIEARQQSDLKASAARVSREQTKRQTETWKAQSEAMRPQVVADLNGRPDVAADKFFGLGELLGQKLDKTYRLDWDSLTPEQRKMVPESYTVRKGGVKPDEVASLFGYQTGDQMLEGLSKITMARDASKLRRDRFDRQMIDGEIQRRMEQEHGLLEKNILEETRDQVLSENQLDLLHEETYKLALDSGEKGYDLTKEQITAQLKEKYDALPVGSVSTEKYLREAGKQGKIAELSLLQNNPADAFKAKQVQYHNIIYAKFAAELEAQRAKLDKAAKPFRKAGMESKIEPEYLNHIQDLLQAGGYKVGRSVENIQENLTRRGKTLEEFANEKLTDSFGYRDIPIADVIVDKGVKAVDQMTTHDFLGYKQTLDALIKNARDEQKIIREGISADRKVVLDDMKSHIERFPLRPQNATATVWDKIKDVPNTFIAGLTNMETFLNRMGNRDPDSSFNKYVTFPAAAAANRKASLQREFSGIYRKIGEVVDKDKLVPSPLVDPLSGQPFARFTRGNVMQMLHNAGNRSNWTVLAKGYGADPEALMHWLVTNTTKEDWGRAQQLGKEVFGKLINLADQEYEHIHGITIDKLKLEPITNAHGTFEGWYHPLVKDPLREGKSPIRDGAYDDSDFGHITTANGYTKKRTGSAYPLDLNPNMTPVRMNQMIHDISFRSFVLETQKIFKDPGLSNTITSHYGAEYNGRAFLIPWLKGIAGQESIPSRAAAKANQISEFLRQNVIGTYIGFNPFTAMKHGPTALVMSARQVGLKNFAGPFAKMTMESVFGEAAAGTFEKIGMDNWAQAVRDLYSRSPDLTMNNHEFVMKWSEEVQRRERHWQDTIFGAHGEIEGANSLREHMIEKGSWLVAKSDMLSAKPTWLASYRNGQKDGLTHGESIARADADVRMAHGSTAITNQPGLVRGHGPLNNWLTSVYGFFGTAMQRRIELAQDIHDTFGLAKQGELNKAASNIPSIMADVMTYVVWPTMVEEWVTGQTTDDRRGLGEHLITASLLGLSSSVLYARDIVNGLVSGHDVGVGLISSPLHDIVKAIKGDVRKDALTRQRMGKTVGDTLTALGHTTGMAPKTIDNAIHFGIDLVNNATHPHTAGDWLRGITKGTTKERVEK